MLAVIKIVKKRNDQTLTIVSKINFRKIAIYCAQTRGKAMEG